MRIKSFLFYCSLFGILFESCGVLCAGLDCSFIHFVLVQPLSEIGFICTVVASGQRTLDTALSATVGGGVFQSASIKIFQYNIRKTIYFQSNIDEILLHFKDTYEGF